MAKSRTIEKKKVLPCLTAAVVCEKVLLEPDSVLSAIRMVDTIILPADARIQAGSILDPNLVLLLMFKSGGAKGERQLRLFLVNPSGGREEIGIWPLNFPVSALAESGHNIRAALRLKWDKEGLYWFEVFVEGTEFARIPVRVRIAKPDHAAKKDTT